MIYTELEIKQKMTKPAVAFNNAVQFVSWRSKMRAAKITTFFGHCFGRIVFKIAFKRFGFNRLPDPD